MMGRLTSPTQITGWAIAAAVALMLGTAAYLALVYSSLPPSLPVQYVRGRPFILELKSPAVVMLPVMVQGSLLAVFGTVMLLLLWRSKASGGVSVEVDADNTRMRLAAEGIALLGVVWTAVQALGAVRLIALWQGAWGGFGRVYTWALIAATVVSIAVIARTIRLVGRQRRHDGPDLPDVWRLQRLYFNPRDPFLFAQTRGGSGWTLNFGRPLAIFLLAVTLLVGVGGPFVLARYVLHGRPF